MSTIGEIISSDLWVAPRAINCLVLDFDGTLVDSNAIKRRAYMDIFPTAGIPNTIVEDMLKRSSGDRYQIIGRIIRELKGRGQINAKINERDLVEQYAERYNTICEGAVSNCREIEGASSVLPMLAARYPLYLNSDTPEISLKRIIKRRKWNHYFRDVLGRPKTKTENLKRIIALEHVSSCEIVVVGDSSRDLHAALRCKCPFIGIKSDGNDFTRRDVLVLENLSHLEQMLRKVAVRNRKDVQK